MNNTKSFRKLIGENVRYFRRKRGLSQSDLAFQSELSPDFISKVERGAANISTDSLFNIGKALKVEPFLFLVSELKRAKELEGRI